MNFVIVSSPSVAMGSRLKILVIILSFIFDLSCAVVYLRPKNDRGPGTCLKCLKLQTIITKTFIHFEGASRSGWQCIEQVERFFFKDNYSIQTQNLAVFHSRNMTSPASEIEIQYLYGLHDRIINLEEGEERFQLKVISNVLKKFSLNNISQKDVILTNLYVIVGDCLQSVSFLSFNLT